MTKKDMQQELGQHEAVAPQTQTQGLSRRSFLTGAGVAAAAAALSGLAACSPSAPTGGADNAPTGSTSGTAGPRVFEVTGQPIETDLVVFGAGAAGCSAAVRAAQQGLRVALLEITDVVGGTTIFTEGLTSLHSKYHTPEIDWATETMVKKIQDYHHWLSDGHIIRQMLTQSAKNVDWLESIGHKFKGLGTMTGATKLTWTMYEHAEGVPSGTDYCAHWSELVTETYSDLITVYFKHEGLQVTVEGGAVKAAIAKDIEADKYLQFDCQAVVFATGGYSDNPELFKEFVGFGEGEYLPMGMNERTGDGIIAGREAGAKLCRYPSCTMWYGGCLEGIHYATELYAGVCFQPMFFVNEKGQRFFDEEYTEHNFSFSGNAQSAQQRVFSIQTQAQMDSWVNEGTIYGCGDYMKPGTKLDGTPTGLSMWDEYNGLVEAGSKYIFKADTLDELAQMTGLPAKGLKAQVELYNGYCASGVDADFEKPAIYMRPLNPEDAPYYAFELKPAVFTTAGGLKVNDTVQCLDTDEQPIIGMYAAGCDAGGLEGDSYDVGICEGSKQCWCAYSGKLAAEHMADTIFGAYQADDFSNPKTW